MVDRTMNRWSEIKRLRLLSLIHSHRGHVKSEISMKDKWTTILHIFTVNYPDMSFKSYTGLQTQFYRIHEKEMLTLGITKAGHNLSGLPEEPTEFQKFCMMIQEDIEAEENEKARDLLKKEKKRKYQACMLTHESTELSKQEKSSTSLSVDKRLTTPTSSKQQNILASERHHHDFVSSVTVPMNFNDIWKL